MSIIQDELAHAHIGYRLLGDLGVDMDWLIYERPAEQFKYPYAFDVPLNSWVELVCANAMYDQAGFVLLSDVYQSSTFGPWKRALAKVDKEETFHLRHGRTWLQEAVQGPRRAGRRCRPRSTGCSSSRSSGSGCPTTARSTPSSWTTASRASPTTSCARAGWARWSRSWRRSGSSVPAHFDAELDRYVIDCPFPARFDADKREWLLDDGRDRVGRGDHALARRAGR